MRTNVEKKHSTKAERVLAEEMKRAHIPFLHRVNVEGREIDFIVGSLAIEIDGHRQDGDKNRMLVKAGYTPLHFTNDEVLKSRKRIINTIKNEFN